MPLNRPRTDAVTARIDDWPCTMRMSSASHALVQSGVRPLLLVNDIQKKIRQHGVGRADGLNRGPMVRCSAQRADLQLGPPRRKDLTGIECCPATLHEAYRRNRRWMTAPSGDLSVDVNFRAAGNVGFAACASVHLLLRPRLARRVERLQPSIVFTLRAAYACPRLPGASLIAINARRNRRRSMRMRDFDSGLVAMTPRDRCVLRANWNPLPLPPADCRTRSRHPTTGGRALTSSVRRFHSFDV